MNPQGCIFVHEKQSKPDQTEDGTAAPDEKAVEWQACKHEEEILSEHWGAVRNECQLIIELFKKIFSLNRWLYSVNRLLWSAPNPRWNLFAQFCWDLSNFMSFADIYRQSRGLDPWETQIVKIFVTILMQINLTNARALRPHRDKREQINFS